MGAKGPWAFLKWANAYGPVFKMQFMDSFSIVLTDYESIMRVTRKTSRLNSPCSCQAYQVLKASGALCMVVKHSVGATLSHNVCICGRACHVPRPTRRVTLLNG